MKFRVVVVLEIQAPNMATGARGVMDLLPFTSNGSTSGVDVAAVEVTKIEKIGA